MELSSVCSVLPFETSPCHDEFLPQALTNVEFSSVPAGVVGVEGVGSVAGPSYGDHFLLDVLCGQPYLETGLDDARLVLTTCLDQLAKAGIHVRTLSSLC